VLLVANDRPATIRHVSASSSDLDTADAQSPSVTALALGPKTTQVAPWTTTIVEVAIDPIDELVPQATVASFNQLQVHCPERAQWRFELQPRSPCGVRWAYDRIGSKRRRGAGSSISPSRYIRSNATRQLMFFKLPSGLRQSSASSPCSSPRCRPSAMPSAGIGCA